MLSFSSLPQDSKSNLFKVGKNNINKIKKKKKGEEMN